MQEQVSPKETAKKFSRLTVLHKSAIVANWRLFHRNDNTIQDSRQFATFYWSAVSSASKRRGYPMVWQPVIHSVQPSYHCLELASRNLFNHHESDKKTEENEQMITDAISEDKDIKELIGKVEELIDLLL